MIHGNIVCAQLTQVSKASGELHTLQVCFVDMINTLMIRWLAFLIIYMYNIIVFICACYSKTNSVHVFILDPDWDFTTGLDDIEAVEKENAKFTCEVNDPQAEVEWFKGKTVSGCQIC